MKIVTVATHSDGYMPILRESCERHGLELIVLGWGEKWQGFTWRQQLVQEYLRQVDPQEVIVFIDAYDVFALQPESVILKRFEQFDSDLVISSEFETSVFARYSARTMYGAPCNGHNLNAGMYMGYAWTLQHFFADLQQLNPLGTEKDDQRLIMRYCRTSKLLEDRERQRRVAVDSDGLLFLNLTAGTCVRGSNQRLYHIDSNHRRLIVNRSQQESCFIHGPGNTNLDAIVELYGFTSQAHPTRSDYRWKFIKTNASVFLPELFFVLMIFLFIFYIAFSIIRKQVNRNKRNK